MFDFLDSPIDVLVENEALDALMEKIRSVESKKTGAKALLKIAEQFKGNEILLPSAYVVHDGNLTIEAGRAKVLFDKPLQSSQFVSKSYVDAVFPNVFNMIGSMSTVVHQVVPSRYESNVSPVLSMELAKSSFLMRNDTRITDFTTDRKDFDSYEDHGVPGVKDIGEKFYAVNDEIDLEKTSIVDSVNAEGIFKNRVSLKRMSFDSLSISAMYTNDERYVNLSRLKREYVTRDDRYLVDGARMHDGMDTNMVPLSDLLSKLKLKAPKRWSPEDRVKKIYVNKTKDQCASELYSMVMSPDEIDPLEPVSYDELVSATRSAVEAVVELAKGDCR